MPKKLRIFHIGPIDVRRPMGLRTSVLNLTKHQRQLPEVDSVFIASTVGDMVPPPNSDFITTEAMFDKIAQNKTSQTTEDVAAFHGYYNMPSVKIARRLKALGIPYIITPRGGLARALRGRGVVKKFLADRLVFDAYIKGAAGIHFLTTDEASNSIPHKRRFFIAGNGASAIPADLPPTLPASKRLFFIGRLDSYHKGLDILLEATALTAGELRHAGFKIDLYGPDMRSDKPLLVKSITKLSIGDIVTIHDKVEGEAKHQAMLAGGVFVHVSRYEGQPQAVLEALAYGLPVLCSKGTNLCDDVRRHALGWCAGDPASDLAATIREIIATWAPESEAKIAARRAYVATACDWPTNAALACAGYRSLLHS